MEDATTTKQSHVQALETRLIAVETAKANTQHYEVGTGVVKRMLGPRIKYSCCLYPTGRETLEQAKLNMLDSYIEKAQLKDGQKVLDLGYASREHDHKTVQVG